MKVQIYLREVVLPYESDECLLWPFSLNRDGYGQGMLDGKTGIISRRICEHFYGPPPTPKYEAAHSCGVRSCVNKRHLSWKTSSENKLDCRNHGTDRQGVRSALAKLNDDQVREIISLYGKATQREIAKLFPVTVWTIARIHKGIGWPYIDRPHLRSNSSATDRPVIKHPPQPRGVCGQYAIAEYRFQKARA